MNDLNNCSNDSNNNAIKREIVLEIETVMGVRTNVQNGEPSDYSESLTK